MATRALICYLDEDRELTCTYNHYDGYPDHLGKILDEHFDGDMYAEKIANEGYISYIDENGNIEAKNKRAPEKVTLNENWEDALDEIAAIIVSYGAEYAYIWWTGDGVWVEIKNTGHRSMVDQLANRMVSAKNIFPKIAVDTTFNQPKRNRMGLRVTKEIKSLNENMKPEDEEDFRLEPEDLDNPDEDLVIIGSGYLDIKNKFGERPSQTNGEYAALGQKVVDQLHKGDKDAALDYIYSKINEDDLKLEPEDEEYDKYADDPNLEVQMDQDLTIDTRLDPYEDREEIEKGIIRLVIAKKSVPESVAKSFVDTHYEDVINMGSDDEILDEFDEFFIINYLEEESNIDIDTSDATAGDDAIERESASGAFEEIYNARGETLKEHFKRLMK